VRVNVIGIGGEPKVGKTEVIKRVVNNLGEPQSVLFGKLKLHYYDSVQLYTVGQYFPKSIMQQGVNALPYSCYSDLKLFIQNQLVAFNEDCTILFEGSKFLLNNPFVNFLNYLPHVELTLISIHCDLQTQMERIAKSGEYYDSVHLHKQYEWLKRMATEYKIIPKPVETEHDMKVLTQLILEMIEYQPEIKEEEEECLLASQQGL